MKERNPSKGGPERVEADLFDRKKQAYFTRLGFKMRQALELHKASGLWVKKEGKRDWGNVSEHCLVEAARAGVLAEELGFSEEIKEALIVAATLHDISKKEEMLAARAAETKGDSVVKALYRVEGEEKRNKLRVAGFSERVIRLVESSGGFPETSLEVRRILEQDRLSEEDLARLAMYYVDAYTRGSHWVEPLNDLGENELDRRTLKTNKKYEDWEKAVTAARVPDEPLFAGGSLSEVLRDLGHRIEVRFSELIEARSGKKIQPEKLPEFVDQEIRDKIKALELNI